MSAAAAEADVKMLARLPGNTVCANCGTTKKLGFSSVCIKFGSFVCNSCKSAHQAISHRCKSLSMSTWSESEVEALRMCGNDVVRNTWLANAPSTGTNGRPQEGDCINVFKSFVMHAYDQKRYLGSQQTSDAPPPKPKRPTKQPPKPSLPPKKKQTPVAPPPPMVMDLLSMDDPIITSHTATTASPVELIAETTQNSEPAPFDPFGNNNITNTSTEPSNPNPTFQYNDNNDNNNISNVSFDPFQNNNNQTMNMNSQQMMNGQSNHNGMMNGNHNEMTNGSNNGNHNGMMNGNNNGSNNGQGNHNGMMNGNNYGMMNNNGSTKKAVMNTNMSSSHFMSPHQNVDNMNMMQKQYQQQQQQMMMMQQQQMVMNKFVPNNNNAMMSMNSFTSTNHASQSKNNNKSSNNGARDPFADLF